jgi:hypothetical protein
MAETSSDVTTKLVEQWIKFFENPNGYIEK